MQLKWKDRMYLQLVYNIDVKSKKIRWFFLLCDLHAVAVVVFAKLITETLCRTCN